ncbi:MAG: glycosyltransferase family 39 protein [archaeon]
MKTKKALTFIAVMGFVSFAFSLLIAGSEFNYSEYSTWAVRFTLTDSLVIGVVELVGLSLVYFLIDWNERTTKLKLNLIELKELLVTVLPIAFLLELPNFMHGISEIDEGIHALAGYFFMKILSSMPHISQALQYLVSHHKGVFAAAFLKFPPVYSVGSGLFYAFGVNPITSRLFPFACGVGISIVVYYTCKLYGVRKEILKLTPLFAYFLPAVYYWSGRPMLDIPLTFFLTLSMYQLLRTLRSPSYDNWLLLSIPLALGFLTKYDVGIIGAPIAIIVLWHGYKTGMFRAIRQASVTLLGFLLLVFPWSYLALYKVPYFTFFWSKGLQGAETSFLMHYPQPVGLAFDIGFACIPLLLAIYLDAKNRTKFDRMTPLTLGIGWLVLYMLMVNVPAVRYVLFAVIPLTVYLLKVLSDNYKPQFHKLLVVVTVLNALLAFTVLFGVVHLPSEKYIASYAWSARFEEPWSEIAQFAGTYTDGNILCDMPSQLQYYLVQGGLYGERTVFTQDSTEEPYYDTVLVKARENDVRLLITLREEPVGPAFKHLRTFEGAPYSYRVYEFTG